MSSTFGLPSPTRLILESGYSSTSRREGLEEAKKELLPIVSSLKKALELIANTSTEDNIREIASKALAESSKSSC